MENASNRTIWIILPIVLVLLFSCVKEDALYLNRGNDHFKKGQYDEAPPEVSAEYSFTTINVPSAYAWGINGSNNIVGWYNGATGMHGFLYVGGSFTPIDVPSASSTLATGINDSNNIVGRYNDATGMHGFFYAGGSFTPIDVPGASWTTPTGINNSNNIVGYYYDATEYHGFFYAGGSFTPIDVPGASWTNAYGINDANNIVGYYHDATGTHGFLYAGGSFTLIDVPGASWTAPSGINNSNNIVGTYFDGIIKHGFLYAGGSFTLIDVPGASGTEANGINDSNNIVGLYYDAEGLHGFLATPVLEPVTIDIKPGSYPNSINLKSKGKISVAILSTNDFNTPSLVDPNSLAFGRTGDEKSLAFCSGAEDVNGDGLLDLVCHFYTQNTGFQCGDTEGILKGKATDNKPIEESDSVKINPCK